jgi:hypothetical protein
MKRTRRPQEDLDAELYSTSVLDQLMESGEWRRVDEVLQLALRAVADALSTHAQSLTDLKALLTTRVLPLPFRHLKPNSQPASPSRLTSPMWPRQ